MAKTDKHSILQTGMAKIAEVAKGAKARISGKVGLGTALVVALVLVVGALMFFKPDLKVVDVVNQKVGAGPTYDELKAAVAKDPKNAALQVDLGHAAWEKGKKETALAAYDKALSLDQSVASTRMTDNLVSCFGTPCQMPAYNIIIARKLVGAEDALRKLVPDKRNVVRANAVSALDKIGKAQKDDWMNLWIQDTTESDCDVRRNAVEKLGEFGDKRGLQAIREAAKKDEQNTKWYQLSCLRGRPEDAEKKILARR